MSHGCGPISTRNIGRWLAAARATNPSARSWREQRSCSASWIWRICPANSLTARSPLKSDSQTMLANILSATKFWVLSIYAEFCMLRRPHRIRWSCSNRPDTVLPPPVSPCPIPEERNGISILCCVIYQAVRSRTVVRNGQPGASGLEKSVAKKL
jgi:hypothetical protein